MEDLVGQWAMVSDGCDGGNGEEGWGVWGRGGKRYMGGPDGWRTPEGRAVSLAEPAMGESMCCFVLLELLK